jgi:hypothetical protein
MAHDGLACVCYRCVGCSRLVHVLGVMFDVATWCGLTCYTLAQVPLAGTISRTQYLDRGCRVGLVATYGFHPGPQHKLDASQDGPECSLRMPCKACRT